MHPLAGRCHSSLLTETAGTEDLSVSLAACLQIQSSNQESQNPLIHWYASICMSLLCIVDLISSCRGAALLVCINCHSIMQKEATATGHSSAFARSFICIIAKQDHKKSSVAAHSLIENYIIYQGD